MPSPRSLPLLVAGAALLVVGAVLLLWRSGPAASETRDEPAALALSAEPRAAPPDAERIVPLAGAGAVPIPEPRAVLSPFIDTLFDTPQAEAPTPAASRTSAVHGRVLDPAELGVAALTVKLYRGREEQQVETDAEGRFAFGELQRGMYRVCVDRASLPAGMCLLPPWKQQADQSHEANATGMYGTAFRLDEASDPEVNLRVFPAGTVRGRLIDVQKRPIVNAVVTIQTAEGLHDAARTDTAGDFVFDEAYPGAYATSVDLSRSQASEASAPLPLQFELPAGGTVVLDDLVAGTGGHILRGTVVDLAGQPVVGLGVLCQEDSDVLYRLRWRVVTDAEGHYEIGRLPSAALLVCVGADDIDRPRADRLLDENLAPLPVDARSAPETIEMGVITVQARHPCHVRGRVQIDAAWAERNGTGRTPRVELREGGEPASRPIEIALEGRDPMYDNERGDTARSDFTWSCATPHTAVEFRAVLTDRDGVEHEARATITPVADGTQEVLLTLP